MTALTESRGPDPLGGPKEGARDAHRGSPGVKKKKGKEEKKEEKGRKRKEKKR